jgi:hypothetical protein
MEEEEPLSWKASNTRDILEEDELSEDEEEHIDADDTFEERGQDSTVPVSRIGITNADKAGLQDVNVSKTNSIIYEMSKVRKLRL